MLGLLGDLKACFSCGVLRTKDFLSICILCGSAVCGVGGCVASCWCDLALAYEIADTEIRESNKLVGALIVDNRYRVLSVTPTALKLSGYASYQGANLLSVIEGESIRTAAAKFERIFMGRSTREQDRTVLLRGDGVRTVVDAKLYPMGDASDIHCAVTIVEHPHGKKMPLDNGVVPVFNPLRRH